MRKKLTDYVIRTLPAPKAGRIEIGDLACRGLSIRVTPNDVRSWSFRYMSPAGRPARMALGIYPEVGLAAARQRADDLRKGVATGVDPIAEKHRARQESGSKTFGQLAATYMEQHALRKKRSAAGDESLLRLHILPKWQHRRFDLITRLDAVDLIEGLIKQGKGITGNRVGALLGKIFNFGIDAGALQFNPCTRLAHRAEENQRTRVLSDDEIKLFWKRTGSLKGNGHSGAALRLMLLVGLRSREAAELQTSELVEVGKGKGILLPATRTKNKREHFIPLGPMARKLIADTLKGREDATFVFEGIEGAPLTNYGLGQTLARIFAVLIDDRPSPHDLRRTFRTRLSAIGISNDICDRLLNHAPIGVGNRHYNQHEYRTEKLAALESWERALMAILVPSEAKIIPIRRRKGLQS